MPMNPEWLPVLGLILAGLFTGALALRALLSRDRRHAVLLGVGAVGWIALALALGRPEFPPDPIRPLTPGPSPVAGAPWTSEVTAGSPGRAAGRRRTR